MSGMEDRDFVHEPGHGDGPNRFGVLSTPERFEDDGTLRGCGVTIAFLDSGFHPHPDIAEPEGRILAYHDVHDPSAPLPPSEGEPHPDCWHGTQTCVAAAGSGRLSDGLYRGLASESSLALVRVARNGRIAEAAIERGLEWVLANRERFGIRVVSLSLGGDEDRTLSESRINRLAEEAVAAGLVLVAAAGNSGCGPAPRVLPPATAPSVIAVGGYDDANDPDRKQLAAYCSSFGVTADGLVKPELIAPAMWVAAPILSGTPPYRRAQALARLAGTPDYRLGRVARELREDLPDLPLEPAVLRAFVEDTLRSERIVAAHYQHVDGTSFAAPIVASVVAQMLEANPRLTPSAVRRLLLGTARSVAELPAIRQGYGVVDPAAAVRAAREEAHAEPPGRSPRLEFGQLVFEFHDDAATTVAVAGDFNDWQPERLPMQRQSGVWRASLPAPVPGLYRYKFLIDRTRWLADPAHSRRQPDPFGGFDSLWGVGGFQP
jgi:serine protease AprX